MTPLKRIVSGGQTGVDRAALDAAMAAGLPHGGKCPAGRRAEDGRIPACYQLEETPSEAYHVRTEENVINSDATLIVYRERLQGGTKLTCRLARKHERPHLLVDLNQAREPEDVARWITENRIGCLNVAGPRESSSNGIGAAARQFLDQVLARIVHE